MSQNQEKSLPIERLKNLLPSKRMVYDMIIEIPGPYGYYLPEINSKAISENYLKSVVQKDVYILKLESMKTGKLLRSATVLELIEEIGKLAGKPLGFDIFTAPDKDWLVNVLYTLKPTHPFFTPALSGIERKLPEELSISCILFLF